MIGIWDAPPLEKTPEELEKERRYREAVQFGADYDRDPNRMLQKLQQQRRSRDVMGQIDPLTQEIIREQEDKSSGAYLDRPYTPGQRAPVPDNSPPPEVGPASPQRVNGPRALRAIMPPREEPPMARANVPGVKFQTNAPLNDEGVAALDQDVMARQMAQAERSNAMRAKVAEALANRQVQPRNPTLHRVRYMAARGLNPDKTPMENPLVDAVRSRMSGKFDPLGQEKLNLQRERLGYQREADLNKNARNAENNNRIRETSKAENDTKVSIANIRKETAAASDLAAKGRGEFSNAVRARNVTLEVVQRQLALERAQQLAMEKEQLKGDSWVPFMGTDGYWKDHLDKQKQRVDALQAKLDSMVNPKKGIQ